MNITYIAIIVFSLLWITSLILYIIANINKSNNIPLDEYTTTFYIEYLDKLIKYKSVYYIDSAFGETFSLKSKVTSDIDNDKILEAHENIIKDILESISIPAKKYLSYLYGEKWLLDYIRIQTLSITLNYTNNTIERLTIEDFK